jgi:pentatricopeptide repeat protein
MDSFFIQVLVRAGLCQEHQRDISTRRNILPFTTKHHRTRRRDTPSAERKAFKSTKSGGGPFKRVGQFAKQELQALVDYYGIKIESEPEPEMVDDGPLIWNVGDDHQPWPVNEPIQTVIIEKLEELLKDENSSHAAIFSYYQLLPTPRVVYLTSKTIRTMLHHLSIVERPDEISAHRFLSILDDMKTSHIHIIRSEWTTAIYFAGRSLGKVSVDELQSALYIWRDMETRAGVRGGFVTLNVLFDAAVKAGKYTLAESFIKEMHARRLKFHRHFRVSLLYYYGVMGRGNAIRNTYKELVEAGDVVDTVVMNAVIASLIRAGEPTAGEHVFERMKRLHAAKTRPPPLPRNWRERRLLGLKLTHEGRKVDKDTELHEELQDSAPMAPDSRTYGLLIRHHASTAGNIDRVTELLEEMQHNSVPIEGTIFIVILYGFNSFGGVRYSSWTRDKLERVWSEYLASVRDDLQRTFLSPMSVIAALKAFRRCTNAERTLQAWEEVQQMWKPKPDELDKVLKTLRRLVPKHPFFNRNM